MTSAPVTEIWRLIARLRREHGKPATVRPVSHRSRGGRHTAGAR